MVVLMVCVCEKVCVCAGGVVESEGGLSGSKSAQSTFRVDLCRWSPPKNLNLEINFSCCQSTKPSLSCTCHFPQSSNVTLFHDWQHICKLLRSFYYVYIHCNLSECSILYPITMSSQHCEYALNYVIHVQ